MYTSTRRIVVLGKTGARKSSLANTMSGKTVFKTGDSPNSETSECQAKIINVNGKLISWIDIPGFFNREKSEEEMKSEILRCITECAPGPHVFLIVLKVEKFTEHEEDVIETIERYFSEEALKYATVVFTHGDQLPEGMEINQFVDQSPDLSSLVRSCGGRCNVIDNRYWKKNDQKEYRTNKFQVTELLNTIDEIIEANKGGYYTTEMLQAVNEEIQQKLSTRRIVVLGKTGAGKSSLANTMSGETVFKTGNSPNSETSKCQAEKISVNGKLLTWIDTPGFFDTGRSEEEMKSEILKCITECAPGPHVFLIVLKVEKFTEHEKDVIETIKRYFSEEALKYATVLFTYGDQLPEGTNINQFVDQSPDLSSLVRSCGGRCNVIDNKYWKKNDQEEYRTNKFQVTELLNTIDEIMNANKGGYYTTEMLQAVNKEIQQERMNQSTADVPPDEIPPNAKTAVHQKLLHRASGVTAGALLGAFLGGGLLLVGGVVPTAGLALGVFLGTTGGMMAGADATKREKAEAPKASEAEEHQGQ